MAKHVEHEEHENHERWLVSYADFITLLFAFFVVMYAVSQVDQKRIMDIQESVRWAMHFEGKGGSETGVGQGGRVPSQVRKRLRDEKGRGAPHAASRIQRRLDESRYAEGRPSVLVLVEGTNLVVRMNVNDVFGPGDSILKPEVLPALDIVLDEVGRLKRPVRIEGHTDDTRAVGGPIDENWALSSMRAAAVASYADASGVIKGALLSTAGYGSHKPLSIADTEEARARNRRIDIVVSMFDSNEAERDEASGIISDTHGSGPIDVP